MAHIGVVLSSARNRLKKILKLSFSGHEPQNVTHLSPVEEAALGEDEVPHLVSHGSFPHHLIIGKPSPGMQALSSDDEMLLELNLSSG